MLYTVNDSMVELIEAFEQLKCSKSSLKGFCGVGMLADISNGFTREWDFRRRRLDAIARSALTS